MFRKFTIKKSVIVLVALLMCALVVLTACDSAESFQSVPFENGKQVDGNGGVAVRYGDYIYYLNGNQTTATEKNGYTNDVRIGAIARIKIADLETIIGLNTMDTENKASLISNAVQEKAEIVIPRFYYTGNSSIPSLNGIFIFNDRIYITTPNDSMDANGNLLSSQLVLASYNLGGGDEQRHFVFESNAPQLKLSQLGDDVYATYFLSNTLATFKVTGSVSSSAVTEIAKEITAVNFTSEKDTNGNVIADYVYYIDGDGAIRQFKVGETEAKVIVEAEVDDSDGHEHNITYTISSVNGGYVYYTRSDNSNILYCATAEDSKIEVLGTTTSGYGWRNRVLYTQSSDEEGTTLYHIYVASGDGSYKKDIINPVQNGSSIAFDRLEGDVLYYHTNNIYYKLDLSAFDFDNSSYLQPEAYAFSVGTTTTWPAADVLSFSWNNGTETKQITYVFTISTSNVTVVKFNPARNNNYIEGTKDTSSSTNITLNITAAEEKTDKK